MNNTEELEELIVTASTYGTPRPGVQFGNSVLVGANVSGAQISTDPSVGPIQVSVPLSCKEQVWEGRIGLTQRFRELSLISARGVMISIWSSTAITPSFTVGRMRSMMFFCSLLYWWDVCPAKNRPSLVRTVRPREPELRLPTSNNSRWNSGINIADKPGIILSEPSDLREVRAGYLLPLPFHGDRFADSGFEHSMEVDGADGW